MDGSSGLGNDSFRIKVACRGGLLRAVARRWRGGDEEAVTGVIGFTAVTPSRLPERVLFHVVTASLVVVRVQFIAF